MNLKRGILLMGLVCWMPFGTLQAAQPNIIFILTDDLGYGDVGVFFQNLRRAQNDPAQPSHLTPQLDQLAAEGTQLHRQYCAAPVCAPSRASLLLGVHQGHANVRDNQFDKALENNHTLGTVMRQAGYATVAVGKWGLQGGKETSEENSSAGDQMKLPDWPAFPTKRGFDEYFGYIRHGDGHEHYPKESIYSRNQRPKEMWWNATNVTPQLDTCYTTDLWTAWAKQWIIAHKQKNPAQPFFMYLAYDTPHAVLELPTQAYPTGGGIKGGLQWLGQPGHMINTASGKIDSYYHPDYAHARWKNGSNLAPWPDVYQRFATSVRRIDDCVGDLLALLKQLKIDDNTLIVFTSDNGPSKESYLRQDYSPEFFRSFGPYDGIKRDTLEGGICVGAIARLPGIVKAGTVSWLPSSHHDWLATFADLAGLTAPARSDGVSLLPTLSGTGEQRTPQVYVEYFEGGKTPNYDSFSPSRRGRQRSQMQTVTVGGYQGVRYNVRSANDDFEIFDLTKDPKQTNNLALQPAFAALNQQMKERVLQLRRPNESAPRPYDSAPVPPATNSVFTNGVIEYAAFEGSWPWVPEFAALKPLRSGKVTGLDLSVRPRDENFGIAFSGFLTVPATGEYTFILKSDSGAHFRIHDATVIDDDFNRTGAEVSGSIRLAAGRHPFRLYYRHATGPRELSLNWSGPTFAKRPLASGDVSLASAVGEKISVPQSALDGEFVRPANRNLRLGFDRATGDEIESDQGDISAKLSGFTDVAGARVKGRWNRALKFNGTNQCALVEADFLPPAGKSPRTTTAWIKTAGNGAIVAWGPNAAGRKWIMRIESDTVVPGVLRLEVGGGFVRGKKDLRDGQWHHVAAVLPTVGTPMARDIKLYVDGVLESNLEVSDAAIHTDAAKLTIGTDSQDRYFVGAIEEVRVFDRALTADEIAGLFSRNNLVDSNSTLPADREMMAVRKLAESGR
jgi:arylsulfatase A-like enzyme